MLTEVSFAELNAMLRSQHLPIIAYFWAPWCPPCKVMTPEVEKAAGALNNRARTVKISAAFDPHALTAFGIASVPTLIVFSAGREINRLTGACFENRILTLVTNSPV